METRTVRIKENGLLGLINAADFDPSRHEEPEAAPPAPRAGESAEDREARLKAQLSEANVAEVSEIISRVTASEDLDEIEAFEKAGKNRAGVHKAIAERRDELKA